MNTVSDSTRAAPQAVSDSAASAGAATTLPPWQLVRGIECPQCKSAELTWAYRYEQPTFRLGAMACPHCGQIYDVTPRRELATECEART